MAKRPSERQYHQIDVRLSGGFQHGSRAGVPMAKLPVAFSEAAQTLHTLGNTVVVNQATAATIATAFSLPDHTDDDRVNNYTALQSDSDSKAVFAGSVLTMARYDPDAPRYDDVANTSGPGNDVYFLDGKHRMRALAAQAVDPAAESNSAVFQIRAVPILDVLRHKAWDEGDAL